ncbi:conserved hypothetical protein [Trichinella spiralis]|uniref:hypothetical protein n=1 Tax=Trichinella spiralis TaxID=6334 RepID=UPI0001EFE147|nr:conserved hypothetical protein [Trichinella spiralis]
MLLERQYRTVCTNHAASSAPLRTKRTPESRGKFGGSSLYARTLISLWNCTKLAIVLIIEWPASRSMFAPEAAQAGFTADFKILELNTFGGLYTKYLKSYQSTLLPPSSLQVATCAIHQTCVQEQEQSLLCTVYYIAECFSAACIINQFTKCRINHSTDVEYCLAHSWVLFQNSLEH